MAHSALWSLRRVSIPTRWYAFSTIASRSCCAESKTAGFYNEHKSEFIEHLPATSNRFLFSKRFSSCSHDTWLHSIGIHRFSSHAGTKSSGEEDDDLEDGFSELDTLANDHTVVENEIEDDLISEAELSDEDIDEKVVEGPEDDLDALDDETEAGKKHAGQRKLSSMLSKAILSAPGVPVHIVMEKWISKGNEVSRVAVSSTMVNLRKRRMFRRALQFSEWLESNKDFEFVERDYASRLDLLSKLHGLTVAERYINDIPESFRGELIYRTLLANCVSSGNVKKTEQIFNKMKDLGFPLSTFACNQLLLLYKRMDKKKIADILLLMEKGNLKPTLFTYKLLIDTKGQSNDISGMEKIIETMKEEGVQPDTYTQFVIAKHFVAGGLKEKAKAVLEEMDGGDLKKHRIACRYLLPLYASLGSADDVKRVWEACSDPRLPEYAAAIEAYGKLKRIDDAEAIFVQMRKSFKTLSSKYYADMLKVYANNNMLSKGKDLVKQMGDSGCRIGPRTWDALVKLYVEAGEVEKADSILNKAAQQSRIKPMFHSFMTIMDKYANRGDVHNTEKIFHRMRQAGYIARLGQFRSLLHAYVNAKAPAYGMRERMKADNVFPNKELAALLAQVDAFKKTAVSELLE